MRTGQKGIDLIKFYEGLHDNDLSTIELEPKMCPAGIWTEGWGNAMRDKNGNFIKGKENKALAYASRTIRTKKQADERLLLALEPRERIIETKVKVPLTQNQFDALVSHLYNTGGSDTLYNLINKKSSPESIKNWLETKYITANGKKLQGLINRRKAESDLFFS